MLVGASINMTLSSGQSWQGVVSGISGDTPLIVRAEVIRGLRCAEGAAEDGACIFGLKLFGSTAPSGVPTEQIDEKQHSAGRPYELIVSSCTLRGNLRGTPPRASYHVSLLGWDGASDLTLSTFEADAPLLRPYCVPAGSAAPSPRHSHGAALVSSRHARGDLMLMFGGSLQHGQPPSEGAGDGLVLSAARPSAELWALHVPSRTWRLLGPDVLPPQPPRPVAGADRNWRLFPAGSSPSPRRHHAMVAVSLPADDEAALLLVAGLSEIAADASLGGEPGGGGGGGGIVLRDVWRLWLPPSADGTVRWEPLAVRVADRADAVQGDDQPAERYGHTAVAFGDRAFVYGGVRESARAREGDQSSRSGVSSDVWEVNAATGEWRAVKAAVPPRGRAFHTATAVGEAMLVFGGVDAQGETLNDLWALHVSTVVGTQWAELRPLSDSRMRLFLGRSRHTAPFVRLAPPNCAAASAPAFATNGTAGGGEPAGEGRLTELLACVPCLAGTRALPASAVDGGAAGGRGDVCQLCPAGWLTTEPGASTCLACPAGTFSSEPGATSWRACRLCPSGSYSPEAGAASCLPCGAAEACPAGSSHPLDPLSLPSHPTGTAPAPSNATWFVGSVSSDFFPQAARRAPSTDQSLARAQLVITTLGGLSFFSFVVVLGLTALYRPRMAELMLRRADVPPISGGPGNSRAGGLFTIAYAFFYASFALAFILQFLFFNEHTSASLIPTPSEHYSVTAATFDARLTALGYTAEQCVLPHAPPGESGACAAGIAVAALGMRLPANGADVSCTFQRSTGPGDSACAITYRCAECHIETAEAQVRFDLSGRFAFAHQITWEASVAWSRRQPIDGRSSLRASIRPPPDALLRGARPSEVTLALVPTVYENSINNTHARGFQLQYIAATVGGTVRAEQVDPIDGTEGRVALSIRLRPLEQEYKLSVTLVRTLIELIAQLMALGSGLSFLCRLTLWLYLRTMHSSAAKLGTRVHASVVRRSQGRDERPHVPRHERRGSKGRSEEWDRARMKRYASHGDRAQLLTDRMPSPRRSPGRHPLEAARPRDSRDSRGSLRLESFRADESFRVMPTATAGVFCNAPPGSRSFTRHATPPLLQWGFVKLVEDDTTSDTEGGRSSSAGPDRPRGAASALPDATAAASSSSWWPPPRSATGMHPPPSTGYPRSFAETSEVPPPPPRSAESGIAMHAVGKAGRDGVSAQPASGRSPEQSGSIIAGSLSGDSTDGESSPPAERRQRGVGSLRRGALVNDAPAQHTRRNSRGGSRSRANGGDGGGGGWGGHSSAAEGERLPRDTDARRALTEAFGGGEPAERGCASTFPSPTQSEGALAATLLAQTPPQSEAAVAGARLASPPGADPLCVQTTDRMDQREGQPAGSSDLSRCSAGSTNATGGECESGRWSQPASPGTPLTPPHGNPHYTVVAGMKSPFGKAFANGS
ncbi:hypothetical protein EMIHUDRAFT_448337 [Emiliania huxleyi CCMP1516]|uniref:Tyrosine-protein kinase ephrin type A/B receptor-like domain-containing protein n=2 Tax=Emiliania huxleyi TaxID=2903 RepID=A0A0D3IDQ5_EMIH1|nr:hypothetical protein EMIHUDRAFT_448337 [Emiliania huxleyi CCMP1516]EOD09390.1 hypothetical protein EMIHUDRAFT_448337 [Emiliania huxleyi CCMP1516]|eukprot:XP_005761819.1 hypothetical protein EMIHUDRAFT_448337 [Emiliania huxleyi CCMP1516]